MDRRFWVCALVVSVSALLLDALVHGVLLQADYRALADAGLVRAPEQARALLPLAVAAHVFAGCGLTWLYRQVAPRGERSLTRGLRFGAAVALAATVPACLLQFALQPWPAALLARQLVGGIAVVLVLGMVLGYLHPRRTAL